MAEDWDLPDLPEMGRGQRTLLGMLGLKELDTRHLWRAVRARMLDIKALIYGGKYSDGEPTGGLRAIETRLDEIHTQLAAIQKLLEEDDGA